MDIAAAITTARAAFETLKALQDVDHAVDKATLKTRLADVMNNLADVRMALAEAKEEAAARDSEIARLRGAFEARDALIEHHGFKYRRREVGP